MTRPKPVLPPRPHASAVKKPYAPPRLTVLGTLEDLTKIKLPTGSPDLCSVCAPVFCSSPS